MDTSAATEAGSLRINMTGSTVLDAGADLGRDTGYHTERRRRCRDGDGDSDKDRGETARTVALLKRTEEIKGRREDMRT